MMGQRIGNVGLLNLLNATEESIKTIERIENVGAVIYRAGNANLLSALNIGNMGTSLELPENYHYYSGELTVDAAYLQSLGGELKLLVNGIVIFKDDVETKDLENQLLTLIVNGEIYTPSHLNGLVSRLFPAGNRTIKSYTGGPPRFENGHFTLSNSFLNAAESPMHLVVDGVFSLSKELDMDLFNEKISNLDVNGVLRIHEEQESYLYKKMASAPNGVVQVIPAGYEVLEKALRLNSRSVRSFKGKKLFTKKPLIFEKDVTREAFDAAIEKVNSKSYIICSEELEDLVYEKLDRLETEVLSYEHQYVLVEDEQNWSNAQFASLPQPVNLIVEGLLILADDVTEETLNSKVAAVDNFGGIESSGDEQKGALQNKLRINEGQLKGPSDDSVGKEYTGLQNVGELAL